MQGFNQHAINDGDARARCECLRNKQAPTDMSHAACQPCGDNLSSGHETYGMMRFYDPVSKLNLVSAWAEKNIGLFARSK